MKPDTYNERVLCQSLILCICPQFCESCLFCKVCVVCTRKSVCLWYTPEIDEIYIFSGGLLMSFKRSRKTSLTPVSAIDHIQPIFTGVLKKPGLKNLCLCVIAILRANNMRINCESRRIKRARSVFCVSLIRRSRSQKRLRAGVRQSFVR